jgi:hypothetical protein
MSARHSSFRTRLGLLTFECRLNPVNGVGPDGVEGPDTDGDGLLNVWETTGIDFNDDGIIDFRPSTLGANPNKKDLFYEVDSMVGLAPEQAAYDIIISRFKNAPVTNPDGSTGINLVFIVDDSNIPTQKTDGSGESVTGMGSAFDVIKNQFYGSAADRAAPNAKNLLAARELAVRYYLMASDTGNNGGFAGINSIYGQTNVGAIAPVLRVPKIYADITMHEIGHNLGLLHGGNTDTNNQPNYFSIMNYLYAYETNQTNTGKIPNHPDYSRQGDPVFNDWGNINMRPNRFLTGNDDIANPNPNPTPNPTPNPNPQQPRRTPEEPLPDSITLGRYATGQDTAAGATLFEGNGKSVFTVNPYPAGTRGARVAVGDVNGDGVVDLVTVPGPGSAVVFKVFSGVDGKQLSETQVFEPSFTGGGFVTVVDFDGDGFAEVVVTPDVGGGPVVAIYSGAKIAAGKSGEAAQVTRFLGIEDANFRGGARPNYADMDGDGDPELLIAAGFGGGPRLAVFIGTTVLAPVEAGKLPPKLISDFFAFENTVRNGVFISAGDLDLDGFDDLILGAGPGGGPRVRISSGRVLLGAAGFKALDDVPAAALANFFAGDPNSRGGVRVAGAALVTDNPAIDLLTGAGEGAPGVVTAYAGRDINANPGSPTKLREFTPYEGSQGVFVG